MSLAFKIILPIAYFVIGAIFASFSNMLMYRFANNKPIFKDERSYCPKCNHQLAWYDNIPILSYLFLGGKCRYCHEPISKRYLLVELFGGFFFLAMYLLYVNFYPTLPSYTSTKALDVINSVTYAFTLLTLLTAAYVDKKKTEVPLSLMIAMLVFGLTNFICSWVFLGFSLTRLLAFVIPLGLLLLMYLFCVVLLKTEPMGLADIIIFSILGLEFGLAGLLVTLLFSSTICSIVEIIKLKKSGERKQIPFVPYIFIGALISVLFTPLIIEGINALMGGL